MPTYDRISARRGQLVNLHTRFLQGGQLADPFDLFRIEIFRAKVTPENVVAIYELPGPTDPTYPAPVEHPSTGIFKLLWPVPDSAIAPDVYFDVWYFYGTDPRLGPGSGTGDVSGTAVDDLGAFTDQLIQTCNRFWVYPDQWFVDGGLETLRFAFEPLDLRFNKPEIRPLEIGLMPLPLYDYDYNFVTPIIPYLSATISITTENCEALVTDAPMSLKLRQGSYRSNPFVVSYLVDTSTFLMGTYKYRVKLLLPDGTTRISGDYIITIA